LYQEASLQREGSLLQEEGGLSAMKIDFAGRAALVTGSSRGLGYAIARAMLLAGARVLLCSRSEENLQTATAALIRERGSTPEGGIADGGRRKGWPDPASPAPVSFVAADLSEPATGPTLAHSAERLFKGLDILVNSVGGPPPGTFDKLSEEDWEGTWRSILLSVVRNIRACLPLLRSSPAPRILTIASMSARQPLPHLLLSNVFRPALVVLAKSLADELAPHGILINNLAPGRFATDRTLALDEAEARRTGRTFDEVRRSREAEIPLDRYGDPAELARVALFLCSDANTYLTGQTILVDGGVTRAL
jgi:3-oxoacyl-[acyl-carrier protein] reductase